MTAGLGVVAADHVARGTSLGIVQIGHGKKSGLTRMRPDDMLAYYSLRDTLGGTLLQKFTVVGIVADGEVSQADEGEFRPWRRRVDYDGSVRPLPLDSMRDQLDLTSGPNWGHQLRRGLVPLSDRDADLLAAAMGAGQ